MWPKFSFRNLPLFDMVEIDLLKTVLESLSLLTTSHRFSFKVFLFINGLFLVIGLVYPVLAVYRFIPFEKVVAS